MILRGYTMLFYPALLAGFASCTSLSSVTNFSSVSSGLIGKFDEISFSAGSYCREFYCVDPRSYLTGFTTQAPDCNCKEFTAADKAIAEINEILLAYLTALQKLSGKNISATAFNRTASAANNLSVATNLGIREQDIKSAKDLANVVSGAVIGVYRRKELRKIVTTANAPLTQVITLQQNNILYLLKILRQEQNELSAVLPSMKLKATDPGVIYLLNLQLIQRTNDLQRQEHFLGLMKDGLGRIREGHQRLYDNHNSLKDALFRKAILEEAEAIQTIIFDFGAIRK